MPPLRKLSRVPEGDVERVGEMVKAEMEGYPRLGRPPRAGVDAGPTLRHDP